VSLADLRAQPWWTGADEAELDQIAWEFVRSAFVHREKCTTCRAGDRWCPLLAEALEHAIDWRDGRILRSKAAFLRLIQARLEEAA
jgi:hypothetical protein